MRHGKPHREQGQIGSQASGTAPGQDAAGRLLEGVGDCDPRGMTVTRQNPAYRPTPFLASSWSSGAAC